MITWQEMKENRLNWSDPNSGLRVHELGNYTNWFTFAFAGCVVGALTWFYLGTAAPAIWVWPVFFCNLFVVWLLKEPGFPRLFLPTISGVTSLTVIGYASSLASYFITLGTDAGLYWAMGLGSVTIASVWFYGLMFKAHWSVPEIAIGNLVGLCLPPLLFGLPASVSITAGLMGAIGLQSCGRWAIKQSRINLQDFREQQEESRKKKVLADLYAAIAREEADRSLMLFERNAEMWKLAQAAQTPLSELTEHLDSVRPTRPWLAEVAIRSSEPLSDLVIRGERHWDGLAEVDIIQVVETVREVIGAARPGFIKSIDVQPIPEAGTLLAPWGSGPSALAGSWVDLILWFAESGAKSVEINGYPIALGALVSFRLEARIGDETLRALDTRQWTTRPARTLLSTLPPSLQQVRCRLESSLWELQTRRLDDGSIFIETFVSLNERSRTQVAPAKGLH